MDTPENGILFKPTAFGGFRKEDVLEYLEKIDIQHTAQIDELKSQVEAINNERNHYANQLQLCDSELTRLQSQLQGMADQLQTQNDIIAAQNAEINMYRTTVTEKETDLKLQSDSIKKLSYENEVLAYKTEQFDLMMANSSDSFYEVKRHADYYLQDLANQNTAISHRTRQSAKQLEQRVSSTLTSLDEMKASMEEMYQQMTTHFGNIEESVKSAGDLLQLNEDTGETSYTAYLREKQEQMETAVSTFLSAEKEALQPPRVSLTKAPSDEPSVKKVPIRKKTGFSFKIPNSSEDFLEKEKSSPEELSKEENLPSFVIPSPPPEKEPEIPVTPKEVKPSSNQIPSTPKVVSVPRTSSTDHTPSPKPSNVKKIEGEPRDPFMLPPDSDF